MQRWMSGQRRQEDVLLLAPCVHHQQLLGLCQEASWGMSDACAGAPGSIAGRQVPAAAHGMLLPSPTHNSSRRSMTPCGLDSRPLLSQCDSRCNSARPCQSQHAPAAGATAVQCARAAGL